MLVLLAGLLSLQSTTVVDQGPPATNPSVALSPQLIRQGPRLPTLAPSGYYWYQIGAIGGSNSYNVDAANITIRTVYDQVRNDAHSYWIGTSLGSAGGPFVQVGYLNGLSTNGQPYCCAWFFETFSTPSCDCPPVIGPEGSAGPIGSFHTYSMVHTGNGVWNFYMDSQLLGHSPFPNQTNYLGPGATNSGSCTTCAPAGIAEVAQTIDNRDVIGPAEFKNIEIHVNGSWQQMQSATTYCCFGYNSNSVLPNPYGVWEVEGVKDDFLAGSSIRQSAKGASLWPTSILLPNSVSFSFTDDSGSSFGDPAWISLEDPSNGNVAYYTGYQGQVIPQSGSGNGVYDVTYVSWHGVNVARSLLVSDSGPQVISGNVFSIPVHVAGRFYSLPVTGATILTFLPDSTNQTLRTDSKGNATLTHLPPGNYSLRVTVPFGVPSLVKASLQGPASLTLSVFSLAELLTIVIPPVAVALAVVFLALRREQARRNAAALTPPFSVTIPVASCGACGSPLDPSDFFCKTCGTPRPGYPQAQQFQQLPPSSSSLPPP